MPSKVFILACAGMYNDNAPLDPPKPMARPIRGHREQRQPQVCRHCRLDSCICTLGIGVPHFKALVIALGMSAVVIGLMHMFKS